MENAMKLLWARLRKVRSRLTEIRLETEKIKSQLKNNHDEILLQKLISLKAEQKKAIKTQFVI